jgi:hypothetical protein
VTPAENNGSFRFEGVPPGSYHLFAFGPVTGYGGAGVVGANPKFARSRVDVTAQSVEGLVVTPRGGATLTVRIKTAAGCAGTAAVALSSLEAWGARLDRTMQASAERDTTVADLAPGSYQVAAQAGGCFQTEDVVADLSSGQAAASIPMAAAGSLRVRLMGGDAAGYTVVLAAAKTFAGEQGMRAARAGRDGIFLFESLPPGSYRIAAQLADSPRSRWLSAEGMIPIRVSGGAPTDVELPVRKD